MLAGSLLPTVTADAEPLGCFPDLSLRDRIIGWLTCYLAGLVISILSFGSFAQLVIGHPLKFALLYSLGNITSLLSTLFLVGPQSQWERMKSPSRRAATLIYLSSLTATLLLCVEAPEQTLLVVAAVLCQWLSLLWYSLSFIPFGQSLARRAAYSIIN
jgi:Got1/Sft2-like family